jgi:hypothetical protein
VAPGAEADLEDAALAGARADPAMALVLDPAGDAAVDVELERVRQLEEAAHVGIIRRHPGIPGARLLPEHAAP